jgi:hypothetical protein
VEVLRDYKKTIPGDGVDFIETASGPALCGARVHACAKVIFAGFTINLLLLYIVVYRIGGGRGCAYLLLYMMPGTRRAGGQI